MASNRIDLGAILGGTNDPYAGFGPAQDFYGLYGPGEIFTGLRKGDETNPQQMGALEALMQGGWGLDAFSNSSGWGGAPSPTSQPTLGNQMPEMSGGMGNPLGGGTPEASGGMGGPSWSGPTAVGQAQNAVDYGIPEWDALFGDEGQVLDADALLRALNVGTLFGEYQTLGDAPYQGANTGNPMLDAWLGGLNDFGLAQNDDRERYFDPNNLAFTDYDLGGIDLRGATLDDLNAWAESQYGPGVDLLTVAASNPELLAARQQAYADPSSVIDPRTGKPRLDLIPGLSEEEAALRLQGYETGLYNQQQEAQQQRQMQQQNALNALLMRDPEAMRNAQYGDLTGRQQMVAGLQGQSAAYAPQPANYEFLAMMGLAPQLTAGVMNQMRLQGGG